MISKNTVFILGAGAHFPFGFPLGRKLAEEIVNRTYIPTNPSAHAEFFELLSQLNQHRHAISALHEGLLKSDEQSIDAFLEKRPELIELGKILIAYQLLPAEKNCKRTRTITDEPSWFEYLWNKWNTSKEDLISGKVSFITFNYDRWLEQRIFSSTQHSYGLTEAETSSLVNKIPIIHVYGSLGTLPHQTTDNANIVPFGDSVNLSTIRRAIKNLKIIHESQELPEQERITELTNNSQIICFLGFGYNRLNIDRLFPSQSLERKQLFGSAYGMGAGEIEALTQYLRTKILKPLPSSGSIILGTSNADARDVLRQLSIFSL